MVAYALVMADHLVLPRPLVLLRTAAWSLTESTGLPIAALALGAWLGGRNAGFVAAVAATWVTAVIRKIVTGSVPSLLKILAIEFTLQAALVIATGKLWIFLLHFPLANLCLFLLFARTARGPNPLLGRLAAEVIGLRQPTTHYPGLLRFFQDGTWLWAGIFLALGAIMSVLLVTEPVPVFLLGSAVATVALIAAGAGASVLWLRHVLRTIGLTVRFALAQARYERRHCLSQPAPVASRPGGNPPRRIRRRARQAWRRLYAGIPAAVRRRQAARPGGIVEITSAH